MTHDPAPSRSLVACVARDSGSIVLADTAINIVEPILLDPLRVSFGFGCRKWGIGLYLTVEDAMRLHASLSRLLADLGERG
jgi:hypothetical protein